MLGKIHPPLRFYIKPKISITLFMSCIVSKSFSFVLISLEAKA